MVAVSSTRLPLPQAPAQRLAIGLSAQSEFDHIVMPRTGMQLPRQLPFENWLSIGKQLSAVATSAAWCLGDWLVYGEAMYSGRYRDAIEQTSLNYQTLRNYAWVTRRFPLSRRRDTLSFGHHAEVAGLSEPEQDFWLRKAEGLSWSRNRLRDEVRASLGQRAAIKELGPAGAGSQDGTDENLAGNSEAGPEPARAGIKRLKVKISLTPQQLEVFRVAAAKAGCTVEAWAASALDRAVREQLT